MKCWTCRFIVSSPSENRSRLTVASGVVRHVPRADANLPKELSFVNLDKSAMGDDSGAVL